MVPLASNALGASIQTNRGKESHVDLAYIGSIVTACGVIVLSSWWLVDVQNLPTVALAAAAIALSVWIGLRVARAQGVVAATPVIGSLSMIVLAWPATTIYFAFAFPDGSYETLTGRTRFLDEAHLLNFAVIVFVTGFALGLAPFLRRNRDTFVEDARYGKTISSVEWGAGLAGLAAVTAGWAGNLLLEQGNLLFVANASRNFLSGFVFVVGYRWHALGRARRWAVAAVLLISAAVNTVANARGLALGPIGFAVAGYLLAPRTTRKARTVIVALIVTVVPVYAVVGNQTRITLQSIGFQNFKERAAVLADAVSGKLVHEQGGFLNDAAARAFSTGGHSLILAHWHHTRLTDLDASRFISELFETALPMFLSSQQNQSPREYTGTAILKEYGFFISETSSVEVSMIGSLCRAGGPAFIFIGGFLIGLGHVTLIGLLKRGMRRSWGVPLAGIVFALSLAVANLDFIQLSRSLLWTMVYSGAVLFSLVALTTLRGVAVSETA